MKLRNIISPAEVDFWLDTDRYSNFIKHESGDALVFNIDMVRLASIRTSISNFVRILTRRYIPVCFIDSDENMNIGGKLIYISAKITTKQEFDCAVGQSLHEGAHSVKTNFEMVKAAWANIPSHLLKLSDSKHIRRASLEKFIHNTWNIIEDRYIDNYVFNEAPGYRGYYVALYEKFWNNPRVSEYLKGEYFRYPSLKSYSFRISNFTNEDTDLYALPCLKEIAQEIDISNIDRLTTTKHRLNTAFKVVEIVLDNIFEELAGEHKTEVDVGKEVIGDFSEVMNGRSTKPENIKAVNKLGNSNEPDEFLAQEIDDVIETQSKFLRGGLPKEKVTKNQKTLLDVIEKHGIELTSVELPIVIPGDTKNIKINCIVVKKMTKELILSGQDIFPLTEVMGVGNSDPIPPKSGSEAIMRGIAMGTKLGRKLQIRSEINISKTIRKKRGKLNKRQLHEAAFDADDLFFKTETDKYTFANLHISVDASGSMNGEKWIHTMIAVVAICKATSMIDNVHVTVSFRTTQLSNETPLPYVIIAYDSAVDKFSKIKQLFPYLIPNGCTPEGLAFDVTMNLFNSSCSKEQDRYFLNLSDGEPYYVLEIPSTKLVINYQNELGISHTKSQVDKIRRNGIEILSYFIEEVTSVKNILSSTSVTKTRSELLHNNFYKMYGKDAKFIQVSEITSLAKTLNQLFLDRNSQKNT